MTGEEAVVLGFILAAFAVFGTTLAWVSSNSGLNNRRRSRLSAADDEASTLVATRAAGRQLSRS